MLSFSKDVLKSLIPNELTRLGILEYNTQYDKVLKEWICTLKFQIIKSQIK